MHEEDDDFLARLVPLCQQMLTCKLREEYTVHLGQLKALMCGRGDNNGVVESARLLARHIGVHADFTDMSIPINKAHSVPEEDYSDTVIDYMTSKVLCQAVGMAKHDKKCVINISIDSGSMRINLTQVKDSEYVVKVWGCVSCTQAEILLRGLGFIDNIEKPLQWTCELHYKDMFSGFVQSVSEHHLKHSLARIQYMQQTDCGSLTFNNGVEYRMQINTANVDIDKTNAAVQQQARQWVNALCVDLHKMPLHEFEAQSRHSDNVICLVQTENSVGELCYGDTVFTMDKVWLHQYAMQRNANNSHFKVIKTLRVFGMFDSVTSLVKHVGLSHVTRVSADLSGEVLSDAQMQTAPETLFCSKPAITFWLLMDTHDNVDHSECYEVTLILSNEINTSAPSGMHRIPTPHNIITSKDGDVLDKSDTVVFYATSTSEDTRVSMRVAKTKISRGARVQEYYHRLKTQLWDAVSIACTELDEQAQHLVDVAKTENDKKLAHTKLTKQQRDTMKMQHWITCYQNNEDIGLDALCAILQTKQLQSILQHVPEMATFMRMLGEKGSYYFAEINLPLQVLVIAAAICDNSDKHMMSLRGMCELTTPERCDDLVTIVVGDDATYKQRLDLVQLLRTWLVPLLNKAHVYAKQFDNNVRTIESAKALLSSECVSPPKFEALDWRLVEYNLFERGAIIHARDDNGNPAAFVFDTLSLKVKRLGDVDVVDTTQTLATRNAPTLPSTSKLFQHHKHAFDQLFPLPLHTAFARPNDAGSICKVLQNRIVGLRNDDAAEECVTLTAHPSANVGALLLDLLPHNNVNWCFTRTHTKAQILDNCGLSSVLALVLNQAEFRVQVRNMETHLRAALCEANHHIEKMCGAQLNHAVSKKDLVKLLSVCAAPFALYIEILNTLFHMVAHMYYAEDSHCDTRRDVLEMYKMLFLESENPTHTIVPLCVYLTSSFSFGMTCDDTFKMFFAVVTHKGNNKSVSPCGEKDKCVLINWRCQSTQGKKRKRCSTHQSATMENSTYLMHRNKLFKPFHSNDVDVHCVYRNNTRTKVVDIEVYDGKLCLETEDGDRLFVENKKEDAFKVKLHTTGPTIGHRRSEGRFAQVYNEMVSMFGQPITTSPTSVFRALSVNKQDLATPIKSNLDAKTNIDFCFTIDKFKAYMSRLQSENEIDAHIKELLLNECRCVCKWVSEKNIASCYLQYIVAPGNWNATTKTSRDQKTQFYVADNLFDALSMKTKKKRADLAQNSMAVGTNANRTSMYTNKDKMLQSSAKIHEHFDPNLTTLNKFLQGGCALIQHNLNTHDDVDHDIQHILTTLPTRLCRVMGIHNKCIEMCDDLVKDISEHMQIT